MIEVKDSKKLNEIIKQQVDLAFSEKESAIIANEYSNKLIYLFNMIDNYNNYSIAKQKLCTGIIQIKKHILINLIKNNYSAPTTIGFEAELNDQINYWKLQDKCEYCIEKINELMERKQDNVTISLKTTTKLLKEKILSYSK